VTGSDIHLLILTVVAIAAVVAGIAALKLHPFLTLLIVALGFGVAAGLGPNGALDAIRIGLGDVLSSSGLVIALGAILGRTFAASGAADALAGAIARFKSPLAAPFLIAALALLLGLPLFFESGVVVMMPAIFALAYKLGQAQGRPAPYLQIALPALAALSVAHGFLPPHPGPLAAIDALHADTGRTLLIGLVMALPIAVLAGPVFTLACLRRTPSAPSEALIAEFVQPQGPAAPGGAGLAATAILLLPVVLMLGKAAVDLALPSAPAARRWVDFVGAAPSAMLIGVLVGLAWVRARQGADAGLSRLVSESLSAVAPIILIVGAGGAFKQSLIQSGVGKAMAHAAMNAHVSPLLLGWTAAAMIRLATGSATVATITAAALMAGVGPSAGSPATLLVLAVGAGSVFFSHVNDAGFWMVKEYLGLSLKDTLKSWSAAETIISVLGLAACLLAGALGIG